MVSLLGLYQQAAHSGVSVDDFALEHRDALTVMDHLQKCHIAIDRRKVKNNADEKYKLSHELAHCETGALYGRKVPFETVARCEERAERWAIENYLPLDEVQYAMDHGLSEPWQLAEWFDFPEEFIRKALNYYHDARGINFQEPA